jgi:MGT family glycosyltransferase
MTALARKLRDRGHDVVVLGLLDAGPLVRAAQLPFIPYCVQEYPSGSVNELLSQLRSLEGREALEFTMHALAKATRRAIDRLPEALAAAGVDALVLDEVLWCVGLVPMHLGMPYVHVSNALTFDFSGNTPLCSYPWPHETTTEGLARNQEGLRQFADIAESYRSVGRDYAKQVGLDIDWADPFATISQRAWLTQTPKAFDFQSSHWPQHYHHTGPFHDGHGRIPSDFPWARLTGEPLIYASMGTLQNGLEPIFSTIAEAVGERPGMQLVMSIGTALNAEQVQSLPANAIVVNYAPQLELLKRSALCITHAGLNTALESLTQGVPMVAIPVTNDQPGVAERIAHGKTGAYVPLQQLTAPRLALLIDEVLGNPEYGQNAATMKQAINGSSGLEKAAGLLEEAFDLPRKTAPPQGALAVN